MTSLPSTSGYSLAGNFCIVCEKWSCNESFHLFPKNVLMRENWINRLGLKPEKVFKNSRICSLHFDGSCYSKTAKTRKRLLPGSLPNSQQFPMSTQEIIQHPEESILEEIQNITPQENSVVNVCLSQSPVTTPSRKRYVGDINCVTDFSTPKRAKRNFEIAANIVMRQRVQISTLQQKVRRLENKMHNIEDILRHLKSKNLISEAAEQVLQTKCSDSLSELFKRKLQGQSRKYSPELRKFALTLQFYSSKAYRYVRKYFGNILPHPSTIAKWYQVVDGDPGFTAEAFSAIKLKASKEEVIVNMTLDEMSIRDHIQWHNNKFHGFIDIGTNNTDDEECPHARNSLVFMAVAINGHWKIPLGYFLINNFNAEERANLLHKCLELLVSTGAKCHSITFDGAAVNIAMCKIFNANFDYGTNNFQPWILNPATKEKIFIFWDAAHMVKLVRNSFASCQEILTSEGTAKWQFICNLQKLQADEGLTAGNKLTKQHINFVEKKMNVRLAAQTLSKSVAAALVFCEQDLHLKEFLECNGTAQFCENFNDAFDLLNSRHCFAKYKYALPISDRTLSNFILKINNIIEYINNLKLKSGFIVNLINAIELYNYLREHTSLKYLPTYKLSQDHLEIFFSAVRNRTGSNNNPSALQFKFAFKRLLLRTQISGSEYGNCVDLQHIPILNINYCTGHSKKGLDFLIDEPNQDWFDRTDHDYMQSLYELSPYLEDIIGYISGFILKKLLKKIVCNACKFQLLSEVCHSDLQKRKEWGHLINASRDVIFICKTAERQLRENQKNLQKKNILSILKNYTYQLVNQSIFLSDEYSAHIANQNLLDNHRYELINLIISQYMNLRFHFFSKEQSMKDSTIRNRLSRLIIFKNQ